MSKLKSIKDFKQEVFSLNDNQLSNVFGGLTDGNEVSMGTCTGGGFESHYLRDGNSYCLDYTLSWTSDVTDANGHTVREGRAYTYGPC
ncbi:hypothetical protein [Flavobacterium sp.]|jgi:hypothetical protein|uniref:hypothetical protein n=1 Tax=Flavobacterium sp. TaxID=239 RepID=UPI0037C10F1B